METKQWECEYKPPSNYDRGHWRIYQAGITKEGFRHLMAGARRRREETLKGAQTAEWSGSPDPADPDNYWIDDETGERVHAVDA